MFKLGERVFDINYGWGTVAHGSPRYPVGVNFDTGFNVQYLKDGAIQEVCHRTLYHHDYTPKESVVDSIEAGKSENDLLLQKFAGMAMQGILAGREYEFVDDYKNLADVAVNVADALIKALETKNNA